MIDLRPVIRVVGIVLCLLSVAMIPSAIADASVGNPEWQAFVAAGGITLFMGLALVLGAGPEHRELDIRQAFLASTLAWVVPAFYAGLPFMLGPTDLSLTDAVFEATSGLTTTGSTVIAGLARLPPGILLWRGVLQWTGGIGIIVMAVAVLPVLKIGGMQMFRVEVTSPSERAAPRAARVGGVIVGVYIGLSLLLFAALWLAGMPAFDSLVHAMSTIATGGFSTYDTSLAYFNSARIDLIVFIGMVVGGMPFLLFFQAASGNWRAVFRDQQIHWYLGLMGLGAAAVTLWLMNSRGYDLVNALRHGAFTVASVMTGTGLTTIDYSDWAGMPIAILFFLTFVGGCAGSTAAGIKVFRFQFLLANALVQIRHLLRPHAVLIPTFNGKPINEEVLRSVMGFLFVYALAFAVLSMALAFLGLDFVTAISGAAAAISNVGPGIGPTIGPDSTFVTLPDLAKWLLAAGMVFGRLEMFTILVLFVPSFWRH